MSASVCVCEHVCVCDRVCVCMCLHVFVYVCEKYILIYVFVHVCTCVVHACMHVGMHEYVCSVAGKERWRKWEWEEPHKAV